MAFDMYIGSMNEKIHYSDEDFFMLVIREEGFPNLEWLWDNFYSSPKIYSDRSSAIISELAKARGVKSIKSRKEFISFIERVTPFFKNAYDSNVTINCVSDERTI